MQYNKAKRCDKYGVCHITTNYLLRTLGLVVFLQDLKVTK